MSNRRGHMAAAVIGAVLLAGCSAHASQSPTKGGHHPARQGATRASTTVVPTAHLLGSARRHAWHRPVVVAAANGRITSVLLRGGGGSMTGQTTSDGLRWRSTGQLVPKTRYTAVVHLVGENGRKRVTTLTLRTGKAARTLTMQATPGPGWTVGVGEPVTVTFNRPVPDRGAVQRRMSVTTDKGAVNGAWHWFSSTVVHFRPRHFWPAHTRVHVHVDLRGVYAGHGVWGDRDHDWSWRVGDRHITYVNARKDTFRVTDNGALAERWPTGMGMPGFRTRDGVYTVLGTLPVVQMTSCSVGLSCTPGSANYYNLTVYWDTQLTDTGTYVHAAPWDSALGYANTSHGCIHLSTADAKRFYRFSNPGDVVIVRGSGRAHALSGDPGMMDWNMPWSRWVAASRG